jgi:hypothetical protein
MGARLDPVMSFPPSGRSRPAATAAPATRRSLPRRLTAGPPPQAAAVAKAARPGVTTAARRPACRLQTCLWPVHGALSAQDIHIGGPAMAQGQAQNPRAPSASHPTGMGRRSSRTSVRSVTADMCGADAPSPGLRRCLLGTILPRRVKQGTCRTTRLCRQGQRHRPTAPGQVLPRRARAQLPQDHVDHLPVITPPDRRPPAAGPPGSPPPRLVTWTGLAGWLRTPRPPPAPSPTPAIRPKRSPAWPPRSPKPVTL